MKKSDLAFELLNTGKKRFEGDKFEEKRKLNGVFGYKAPQPFMASHTLASQRS